MFIQRIKFYTDSLYLIQFYSPFHFRCAHITDIGVGYLSTMTSLTRLFLRWCTQLRDFGLQHLYTMKSLKVLSLAGNFLQSIAVILQKLKLLLAKAGGASWWTSEVENDRISMKKTNYIKSLQCYLFCTKCVCTATTLTCQFY